MKETIGSLLITSSRLMKRTMDEQLKEYNLTSSQWALLKLLSEEQNLTQAQLAQRSLSDRATTGTIIDKLIEKGFICKKQGEQDRRSYVVSITEDGKNIARSIMYLGIEHNNRAVTGLSQEEITTLVSCLKTMIENLR